MKGAHSRSHPPPMMLFSTVLYTVSNCRRDRDDHPFSSELAGRYCASRLKYSAFDNLGTIVITISTLIVLPGLCIHLPECSLLAISCHHYCAGGPTSADYSQEVTLGSWYCYILNRQYWHNIATKLSQKSSVHHQVTGWKLCADCS